MSRERSYFHEGKINEVGERERENVKNGKSKIDREREVREEGTSREGGRKEYQQKLKK